jgi:hypothetical protein
MFPVFPVLFPVCSQLKPMKRIAVPSVPSCSASDYFVKCDWGDWKSSERSGNTWNGRNHAVYQSVALFPVEGRSGNSGNKRRELKNGSRRRIWERSKSNLRAPALAPVKPYASWVFAVLLLVATSKPGTCRSAMTPSRICDLAGAPVR